jgi:bis(5'-nucleosyl)-tetraphosphatase (symmetrical)
VAVYAVGDVQGCWRELEALLHKVQFKDTDELWLAGDLINRGPDSLKVLRKLRAFGAQTRIVLGNHDLHFLAIVFGGHSAGAKDTLGNLLAADDVEELAHWLRRQKLLHTDFGHIMVHAGLPPQWGLEQARSYAQEVEAVIGQSDKDAETAAISYRDFFAAMYGNKPSRWDPALTGMDRLRCIVNYLTRMRLLFPDGSMDFAHKGPVRDLPQGLTPWFASEPGQRDGQTLLFGHWASLNGDARAPHCVALDTGCVWGRKLTAYRLDDGVKITQKAMTGQ